VDLIYKAVKAGELTVSGSELEESMKDYIDINVFDFAGVIGSQYTFLKQLTIGGRYNLGLNSIMGISDEGNDEKLSVSGLSNRVIRLSVGYAF